jgi:hypothetical protein
MSEQEENTGLTLEGLAQRPEALERQDIPASRLTPRLDGWEVTQAIQDINHTVTLIASKRTVVRMYLSSPRVGSRVTVRGELALRRSPGGPPVTIPSLNRVVLSPAQVGKLDAKRRKVQLSLNFLLPVDQTRAGRLNISLASLTNARTGIPFDVSLNNLDATRTVTFTASAPLRVRILGIRYQCSGPTGTPPVTHTPAQRDFDMINSWLRRAYPVAEVISSQAIIDGPWTQPLLDCPAPSGMGSACNAVNALLAAIRAQDVGAGTDRRTHYYGLVSDGGFAMGGCAAIPSEVDPSAVASGKTGDPARGSAEVNWDTDGSYGDWYAGHELGHTLGRKHPGFCRQTRDDENYPFVKGQLANADDAFVGFDVGDPAQNLPMVALPGVDWHDVMTYCPNRWLSSYTYEAIRRRLRREDLLNPGPSLGPGSGSGAGMPQGKQVPETITREEAAERTLISVVATVNLTQGEGKIKYVNPLSQGEASRTEPDGSPVMFRVKGADGRVLHEYRPSVKPFSNRSPEGDQLGLVDVVLAVQPDARVVELSVAGNVVDTFRAGATPPDVHGARRTDAQGDQLSLDWQTETETGDHTYIVQVSTDNEKSWQTLAVGLATPEVTIDRNQFYGAENVLVRVIATDGFRRSVAMSEPLSIDT